MRWFRRKKKDEPEKAAQEEKVDKSALPESSIVSLANPIEAYIQRLDDLLADPEISEKTKAIQDTTLQLIVGGEPILMKKKGVAPMSLSLERSIQTDVFIRMSEEAAGVLAMTTTLADFKKAYKKMVDVTGEASYVNIKLHTPLEDLRTKGYFSIELLRILIDA
jgi:hypothetical protein